MNAERSNLAAALDLLASTEDAEWNPEVKDFLRAHGYVERPNHSRYSLDQRAFIPTSEQRERGT